MHVSTNLSSILGKTAREK